MTYGYCRVSTKQQSIARQHENILRVYPDAKLVDEHYTGTTIERPAWQVLEKNLKTGDKVVFDSVSRMSRSASEGWTLYEHLMERGINLAFLKEPAIDTAVYRDAMNRQIAAASTGDGMTDELIHGITSAINTYMKRLAERQIQIAFEQSEKEVKDLQIRTAEGMKASGAPEKISASRTGKQYNSKKKNEAIEVIKKHSKDFGGTLSDNDCIKLTGVSRMSYYRYKAEIKAQ